MPPILTGMNACMRNIKTSRSVNACLALLKIPESVYNQLASSFRSHLQTALDFVFPAECAACHEFAGDQRIVIFCQSCWETIRPFPASGCTQCGKPLFGVTPPSGFLCGDCRISPPYFDRVFSASIYDGVMKEAIHQFKFSRRFRLGQPLARLLLTQLAEHIEFSTYHAVLPIPLHRSRSKQRGYNQAEILAREVAAAHHLSLLTKNLIRIRRTEAQWQFNNKRERMKNVKNAFQVCQPEQIREKRLLLIDDIFTTGSTANECAKTLKQAGAASVVVLTVSRAGLGQHSPL